MFLFFLSQWLRERKIERSTYTKRLDDEWNKQVAEWKEETTEEDIYSADLSLRHELNENVDEKPPEPLR